MWNRPVFETLVEELPFDIHVVWDKAPSFDKYGHVNCFLTSVIALYKRGGSFTDAEGRKLESVVIQPLRRKLTDKKKRSFSIVGLNDVSPTWVYKLDELVIEIYFNYHFFYETDTTYRQYFPSACAILRCRNFLQWSFVPSPSSWGGDIVHLTFDWNGTYILEAGSHGVKTAFRKNFKGYKYFPSKFKYFISSKQLPKSELEFILNNGFEVLVSETGDSQPDKTIKSTVDHFLDQQLKRYAKFMRKSKHSGTN